MQLFSHNSDMLIPNLSHAKLYFKFSLSKLQNTMAAKIADKVSIIMIIHHVWVHSGHTNLTFVLFLMAKYRFLIPINLVQYSNNFYITCSFREKSKMAANYTASANTIFLNVVGSFFLPKKYTASKNSTSMLHVVTGNAKNMII